MKTSHARRRAKSVKKLAELLGISHQAIYKWGVTVPEPSLSKLRDLRPEWFAAPKPRKAP